MSTPSQDHNGEQSIWKQILGLSKLKVPTWAVLLIVLFGSGGVFYRFSDYYQKHQAEERARRQGYEGGPTLGYVGVTASFLPPVAVTSPTSMFVRVSNDSQSWAVPNLAVVLDTGSSKIDSCELRAATGPQTTPEKNGEGLFSVSLKQLSPREVFGLYCLGTDIHDVTVTLNSRDSLGNVIGSNTFRFTRSEQTMPGAEPGGGAFAEFVSFLAGALLLVLAVCLAALIFGLTGKLFKRLGIFQ